MRVLPSLALWLPAIALSVVLVVYLWLAISSRRMPSLQVWHTVHLDAEFRARDLTAGADLAGYLEHERAVFAQLESVLATAGPTALPLGRYQPGGRNDPNTFPVNWNRSFEMQPAAARGAALLLHGLTDSPYSLRRIGEVLRDRGFYVLSLRLPGHGTVPAALNDVSREDWRAAVRIGAAHARTRAGTGAPFWIVGYSNGGSLAVDHALAAVADAALARPSRLILISPAIGVSPFAAIGRWHRPLSALPLFEKFKWHTIYPEHDPFKYNSFPKSAAYQTHQLIAELRASLERVVREGRADELPPILAFQSAADATVRTPAVLDGLFRPIGGAANELVVFDINRVSYMREYFADDPTQWLAELRSQPGLPFRLTLITNADSNTQAVVARSWPPGAGQPTDKPLGLSWPLGVYSLSHVSLPFPPDDPLYGAGTNGIPDWGVPLGSLEPRGERELLAVPIELFTRLRYNPFFPYLERRLDDLARGDS